MIVKAYVDNATTGTTLSGLACVAGTTTGTFACTAALPALTPGAHTLTATVTMGALESAKSSSVGFAYVVLAILNLKIV